MPKRAGLGLGLGLMSHWEADAIEFKHSRVNKNRFERPLELNQSVRQYPGRERTLASGTFTSTLTVWYSISFELGE
jgi:hypothetical protein